MKTKFERVSLLPPYVFAEINELKAKERLKGRDVIDLVWVILIIVLLNIL